MSDENRSYLKDASDETQTKQDDRNQDAVPPGFGRGRGWGEGYPRGARQRRRFRRQTGSPSGSCICPNCGHAVKHEIGQPCYLQTCPECGARLMRQ